MADFNSIFNWVMLQEDSTLSGKIVDLGDGQGPTRFGLGQKSHPELPREFFYSMDNHTAFGFAKNAYKSIYWNRFCGDQINSDDVASCLLSFSINDGTSREVKMLQECLGVTVDGSFGPVTLQHTNAYNPTQLAAALRAAQADWYRAIVAANPSDEKFLNGWLRRAARIYPSLA